MSKLSICENNWINIVFEGKNKEYGAYQLRKESDRTTLLAFFMGSMIVTSLISISMLINLFSTNEKIKFKHQGRGTYQSNHCKTYRCQSGHSKKY